MIAVINYFLTFSIWVDVRNSLLKRSNQLSFNTCADLGIFARGSRLNCQKTALTFFFLLFFLFYSPQLIIQFLKRFVNGLFKKTVIFKGFRGGPTFTRGGGP